MPRNHSLYLTIKTLVPHKPGLLHTGALGPGFGIFKSKN
jgi:hypothetical protein